MFRLKVGNQVYRPSSSIIATAILCCIGLFVISLLVHMMSVADTNAQGHLALTHIMIERASTISKPLAIPRDVARPPKEEIFLSREQSVIAATNSPVTYAYFSSFTEYLNLTGCLTTEAAIQRNFKVDIVDQSTSVSSYLSSLPSSQVVLLSFGAPIWFTSKAGPELALRFLGNFNPGTVLLPATRICTGSEDECKEEAKLVDGSSFKYISPKAALGRVDSLSAFFSGCASPDCIRAGYLSKKFPALIDWHSDFFQDMQDVDMKSLDPLKFGDAAKSDGKWQAPADGGELRNPETHSFPPLLIFGEKFPAFAGAWRVKHFTFQPQSLMSVRGQEKSFLQEVCPHSVLPWLPLNVAANPFRKDARCSDVCVDSHVKCSKREYPGEGQVMSECDPNSEYHCCSPSGWCGYTKEHCDCPLCVNYRDIADKRRLMN